MWPCSHRERGTYLGVALEAKVNHHNGREQHNGENNKHQEQIKEKDQGVHGSYHQAPRQAAPGAARLPGKELVIHVIRGEPRDHPRPFREDFCSQVLSVLARHSSRRCTNPRSYPKGVPCFWSDRAGKEFAKAPSASSTRGQEPLTRDHRGARKERSLWAPCFPRACSAQFASFRCFSSSVPASVPKQIWLLEVWQSLLFWFRIQSPTELLVVFPRITIPRGPKGLLW